MGITSAKHILLFVKYQTLYTKYSYKGFRHYQNRNNSFPFCNHRLGHLQLQVSQTEGSHMLAMLFLLLNVLIIEKVRKFPSVFLLCRLGLLSHFK